jgi:antitoxin component HigA of HigAB toxin-antitoxin module
MIIKTEEEYEAALKEVEGYFTAQYDWGNNINDPRCNELFDAIEAYEDIHYPISELVDQCQPIDPDFVGRMIKLVGDAEVDLNEEIKGDIYGE